MKWIAVILMILDHIGHYFNDSIISIDMRYYMILRSVGRLSFPVFAYYVGVGCGRTRSKIKYFLRMTVFAALSEFLMEFTANQTGQSRGHMNVMLTFALSMILIFSWESFIESWHRLDDGQFLASTTGRNRTLNRKVLWDFIVLSGTVVLMFASLFASHFFKTDYGIYGVLTVFMFYYVNKNIRKSALPLRQDRQAFFAFLIGFSFINFIWHLIAPAIHAPVQSLSVLSVLLLLLEPKAKERPGIVSKYFFYIFYPLHCCLFMLLNYWMNNS